MAENDDKRDARVPSLEFREAQKLLLKHSNAIKKFKHQRNFFNQTRNEAITLDGYILREQAMRGAIAELEDNHPELVSALMMEKLMSDDGQADGSLHPEDLPAVVTVGEELEEIREQYFELATVVSEAIRRLRARESAEQEESDARSHLGRVWPTSEARAPCVKTPRITVPEFDGSVEKWSAFRDLFVALIHENSQLTSVEKFKHLETALKIPPNQTNVLSNFRLTAESYEAAWKAVVARYDDKRRILSHHLDALLTMKTMTTNSASELRKLMDGVTAHLSSLSHMGYALEDEDDFANLFIVHIVNHRMDACTRLEWRKHHKGDTAKWSEMFEFLNAHWSVLDEPKPVKSAESRAMSKPKVHAVSGSASGGNSKPTCVVCGERHFMWECSKFLAMSVESRSNVIRQYKMCLICFSTKHRRTECNSKFQCPCKRGHHELLHRNMASSNDTSKLTTSAQVPSAPPAQSVPPFVPHQMNLQTNVSAHCSEEGSGQMHSAVGRTFLAHRQTLLTTALVLVRDSVGEYQGCRALLDSGSDTNFISARFAKQLGLRLIDFGMTISGVDHNVTYTKHRTEASVASRYGAYERSLSFVVLEKVTGEIPSQHISGETIGNIEGYFLADPRYGEVEATDMLLNNEVYLDCLLNDKIRLPSGPMMLHSKFGWLIGGELKKQHADARHLLSSHSFAHVMHSCAAGQLQTSDVEENLSEKLQEFLEREDVDSRAVVVTREERHCEMIFTDFTTRDENGRFIVALPVKEGIEELGTNLRNAEIQASWLEKRFIKDPELKKLYNEYMSEYLESGDMSEVPPTQDVGYYMPHHGVKKMTSTTTKLRPVFNASSKSESGKSLNELLCVGPKVQSESFDILLRFREKKYAITGDIAKMYRRLLVHESQRDWLKVLWRTDEAQPMKHLRLNTLPFGIAPASFLATRAVKQLSLEHADTYPEAAQILAESFYVDDAIFNVDSVGEGIQRIDEVRNILASAGMRLRKIAATDQMILINVHEEDRDVPSGTERNVRTALGLVFDEVNDHFSYKVEKLSEDSNRVLTKAKVLSQILSIYDPIGWIGPVVVKAKMFMRKILKFDWKEKLTEDLQDEWNEFREKLHLVNELKIPRFMAIDRHIICELHGFSDASILAYGACIYVVTYDTEGRCKVVLLCAKSRIAPSKQKSLARLELCAATLLSILINRILGILKIKVDEVVLWTDSTIALQWMAMEPNTLSTYAGNRVAVVQELTHAFKWRHVSGVDNPADVISRGLMPGEIESCELWWSGPEFLQKPKNEWPVSIMTINDDDVEFKNEVKRAHVVVSDVSPLFHSIETRFSNTRSTINSVAYRLRVFNHFKKDVNVGHGQTISLYEYDAAKKEVIREIQKTIFAEEVKVLRLEREQKKVCQRLTRIHRKSSIYHLGPFMDHEGIIRVVGRIDASVELTDSQKHPIIMPQCNFMTRLVIELHKKHLHPGQLLLRSIIRQEFWLIKAADLVKKVSRECFRCFRAKPAPSMQYMADLPAARVNVAPAFTRTAVDYAGFFTIRSGTTRNAPKTKCYIAMFKCVVTGGIHLEVVSDLTTKAFLAALDRFIARRGLCREIFSDNATCFEGADNELKKISTSMQDAVKQHCANRSIYWKFTTPRAPHAGGIYESGIKLVKKHLKHLIIQSFTFEEFSTLLCKIEAILNSRPVTPMSEDPMDMRALTVGDLIIGRPLVARNEHDLSDIPANRLKHWEAAQQVAHQFWHRWRNEYLPELQLRPKSFREKYEFKVGDMVLVNDPNLPPQKWLLGRIAKLHTSKDKVVRTVTVMTKDGEKQRHVKYLSLLPMETEFSSEAEDVSAVAATKMN